MLFAFQRTELLEIAGLTRTLKREQHTRNAFVRASGSSLPLYV